MRVIVRNGVRLTGGTEDTAPVLGTRLTGGGGAEDTAPVLGVRMTVSSYAA